MKKTIKKSIWSLAIAATSLALVLVALHTAALAGPPAAAQIPQTDGNNGTQIANTTTTATTTNNTSLTSTSNTSGGIDCNRIASQLGGMVLPNPTGICDVTVPVKGLMVVDNATGTRINQLLVINPIFEFAPIPGANNNNSSSAGNNTSGQGPVVYGFAEIGASEDQLPSVMRMLSNSSWNIVAVHNHVAMESPKMLFVHATGMSDINTLTSEAKMVLDNITNQQQQQQTNNTASASSSATNSGETSSSSSSQSGAQQGSGQQPTTTTIS